MSWWEGEKKTQLPRCLSPVLLLKERGEGDAGRLLAPSVHVFCIPALIFSLVCSPFKCGDRRCLLCGREICILFISGLLQVVFPRVRQQVRAPSVSIRVWPDLWVSMFALAGSFCLCLPPISPISRESPPSAFIVAAGWICPHCFLSHWHIFFSTNCSWNHPAPCLSHPPL